jgi:hypothetical protein
MTKRSTDAEIEALLTRCERLRRHAAAAQEKANEATAKLVAALRHSTPAKKAKKR